MPDLADIGKTSWIAIVQQVRFTIHLTLQMVGPGPAHRRRIHCAVFLGLHLHSHSRIVMNRWPRKKTTRSVPARNTRAVSVGLSGCFFPSVTVSCPCPCSVQVSSMTPSSSLMKIEMLGERCSRTSW